MTQLFEKISGFSFRTVGTLTPVPLFLAAIDSPRQGGPVGMTTLFGYLRTTTILTDRISGELIDFILFWNPPGIISTHSGGGTNPQPLSRTLP